MIEHEGANIQLLDLPGIIEGASQGKGVIQIFRPRYYWRRRFLNFVFSPIHLNVTLFHCLDVDFFKGRGRQVIAVAKTADLIMMMLDAGKSDEQRMLLERELEAVGIRLNKRPPNIYVKQKKVGCQYFINIAKSLMTRDRLPISSVEG